MYNHHSRGKAAVRKMAEKTGRKVGRRRARILIRMPNSNHLLDNGLKVKAD